MTSDKLGLLQAHKATPEGSKAAVHVQQPRQLAGSHQNSNSPPSLFDHNSSNFLSPAFSATTANSRPVSGISSLPSPTFRDSFISIIDDPFFQKLQEQEQFDDHEADTESISNETTPEPDRPFPFPAAPRDADEHKKQDAVNFEVGPSPRHSRRPSERSRRASRDDKKAPTKQMKWPPPRRESLTVGSLQGWSGVSNWV